MKSKLKWVSGILGAVLALSLVFGAGVYASQWLNFTGKEQIEQSESDIDKIMQILEDVNNGKITAENAIPVLEGSIEQLKTDKGILSTELASKDTQLAKQSTTIEELTSDLTSANQAKTDAENALSGKQEELNNKHQELLNKQKEIEQKNQEIQDKIAEGNHKVAEKQTELDVVVKEREEHKRVAGELQQQINQNSEYVTHLEKELQKANEAAQSVSNKTSEALETARTYQE